MAEGLWLDSLRGQGHCVDLTASVPALGPTQPPFTKGEEELFLWGVADHFPVSITEVRNERSRTSTTPYVVTPCTVTALPYLSNVALCILLLVI